MFAALERHLDPRCVLVGVGNLLHGDDGFGPYVIGLLQSKTSLPLIDAGIAPENVCGGVVRLAPAAVVVFDAISLDAPPGSLHLIKPDELESEGISTHGPSLGLFLEYLKQSTSASVHIVGVIPAQIGLGDAMSTPVRAAAHELAGWIAAQHSQQG